MKRFLLACTFLVLAASVTSVMGQAKKPITKSGLVNAVKSFFDAVKSDDYDKLKTVYGSDYTFTGPDGKMTNAEERLRLLKAQGGSNFVDATELVYRLYGDGAVVTGVATTKTATGAVDKSRFIQVWTMQGGNLRLVASQVTKMD